MAGEAAHMHFVDGALDLRYIMRLAVLPVKMVLGHDAMTFAGHVGCRGSPCVPARHDSGVRVEQSLRRVEAIDHGIGIGLHVEAKREVRTYIETLDKDVPNLSGAVGVRIQR